MTMPDWIIPDAHVVEVGNDGATWSTIVRVTPTGMIRRGNGSMYRLQEGWGRTPLKAGERGPWVGARTPTKLQAADEYRRNMSVRIVARAAHTIGLMEVRTGDPHVRLREMQAVVDTARDQLAEFDQQVERHMSASEEAQR